MNNLSKMFAMCCNWKVLTALAVIGLGLFYFLSPVQAFAALPLLLFALCPLSMVYMMYTMKKKDGESEK